MVAALDLLDVVAAVDSALVFEAFDDGAARASLCLLSTFRLAPRFAADDEADRTGSAATAAAAAVAIAAGVAKPTAAVSSSPSDSWPVKS